MLSNFWGPLLSELWDRLLDMIGMPTSYSKISSKSKNESFSDKVGVGFNLGVRGSGEASATEKYGMQYSRTDNYSVDYSNIITKKLNKTQLVVFIDDFHYLPKEVQLLVAKQIKDMLGKGVRFITATIPYHSDDALKANSDLRGRIVNLDFNYWNTDTLKTIGLKGFKELNIVVPDSVVTGLADESAGSPHLMQYLCLLLCFETGVKVSQQNTKYLDANLDVIESVCTRGASSSDYSSTIDKLRDGPKVDGRDNKHYVLKDESIADIYKLILLALSERPPTLNFRYNELIDRISSCCKNESPSRSSIVIACSQMAKIANDSENNIVFEWDSESDVLDIRDPYFLYSLRWSE